MSTPVLILDPHEVAVNRMELDLNNYSIRVQQDGVDWGDAAISAFMADQRWGSTPVEWRVPNRMVTIPLFLHDVGVFTEERARQQLQQKVGLLQREGGWLKRTAANGDVTYADIVSATLTLPDMWGDRIGVEPNVKLVLECLPDFYGDEIALYSVSPTGTGIVDTLLYDMSDIANINLHPNPSFEINVTNYTGTNGTAVRASAQHYSGAYCAQLTCNGGGNLSFGRTTGYDCSIAPGAYYTGSYYVRSNTTTRSFYIALNWYKADGTFISANTSSTSSSTNNSWTRLSVANNAPNLAVYARLSVVQSGTVPANGEVHYVDGCMITQGTLVSYFDGSTGAYAWLGTPGLSISYLGSAPPDVKGDYPGRTRMVVSDASGNNQLGLLWGLRSKHYDSTNTAALFYEAENLTRVNGATSNALTGASGGNDVEISLPAGVWVSFLSTGAMTHQGSYRVWGRFAATTTDIQYRLQWGVGTLSVPVTNDPVTVIGVGSGNPFSLVDLGEIRIDPVAEGTTQWYGAVQGYSAGGATAHCDALYLQPLDEGAGRLVYTNVPPVSSLGANLAAGSATNNAASGTIDWANLTNIVVRDNNNVTATMTGGQRSKWLTTAGHGFALPTTATVKGIKASVYSVIGTDRFPVSPFIQIVKAGSVSASGIALPALATGVNIIEYGGATELWGTTWTYLDINNAGFGAALQILVGGSGGSCVAYVDSIEITVYYTLASGFTVASDAVVYANQTAELSTQQMLRQPVGTVWSKQSQVYGDLPRLPCSGMEHRGVEAFLKPTRGDFDSLADSGLDISSVQFYYRPCWLSRA